MVTLKENSDSDENTPVSHILTGHSQEINVDSDQITIIPTSTAPVSKDQPK